MKKNKLTPQMSFCNLIFSLLGLNEIDEKLSKKELEYCEKEGHRIGEEIEKMLSASK